MQLSWCSPHTIRPHDRTFQRARASRIPKNLSVLAKVWIGAEVKIGSELKKLPQAKGTRGRLSGKKTGTSKGEGGGKGSSGGSIVAPPEESAPTLKELGLGKKRARRANLRGKPKGAGSSGSPIVAPPDGSPSVQALGLEKKRAARAKGEMAMGVALLFPEAEKGGRGKRTKALETKGFSSPRLSQARAVLRHSPELAHAVRDGTIKLDEALKLGKRGRPKKGEEKVGIANISKGGSTLPTSSPALTATASPSWRPRSAQR